MDPPKSTVTAVTRGVLENRNGYLKGDSSLSPAVTAVTDRPAGITSRSDLNACSVQPLLPDATATRTHHATPWYVLPARQGASAARYGTLVGSSSCVPHGPPARP